MLEALPPFLGGGEMIEVVRMEGSTYAGIPHKFEAGTPPIVEAVGLGAALDYLIGPRHGRRRRPRAGRSRRTPCEGLASVPGLTVLGPTERGRGRSAGERSPSSSPGVHPHDVAQVLDARGVAVRAGHHCARPAHARYGVQSSTRASSYLYTTPAEVDALVEALEHTRHYFKVGETD